ncbi:indole-3-glycerol phosphate synthase TrpC [Candidatus Rhodoluna planktonica]|uniref:indole-3-glycerol-phosphate synthase n=1 Tax=Candidatus Rhodoluna planktonica TaxID=535712 RepID=A0A1D9DZ49_9MICO|nr:indole-3-glycerol phosphate synthase TrpC [Candidatus Rhodoluna planktonica]AOY56076.1 indole-3-glycerol phosphate synthase [Candidatus Rhodoluna planktonica]
MLESLYAGSIEDAAKRAEQVSLNDIERMALAAKPPLDALEAFAPAKHIKVLAEVKRASPSRGQMAEISDPANLAEVYAQNGASGISVLTEERKFKGSLHDLDAVRHRVEVPLLRKDFIANEYQILEARAHGADIILLIVAGLPPKRLIELQHFTEELNMLPFLETHSEDEAKFAIDTGAQFIGVNARDLSTFETDRNLFGKLVELFPANVIKVAESAVRSADDVRHYRQAGADVVLVGEALVTNDAAKLLAEFTAI